MTATLPQLWLLDLRAYQETSRWRTLLPGLPPERQRRALACRWEIDGARLAWRRLSAAADARVSRYPHF